MMTSATLRPEGIEVAFADGHRGLVPFSAIPEITSGAVLVSMEIASPYEITLRPAQGEAVELPWDFVRHYCDPGYRPRVEAVGTAGRQSIGSRIRELRESAGMTQDHLARAAGIGRVTLVRIERGEQSPRYETLTGLASALGIPVSGLLGDQ